MNKLIIFILTLLPVFSYSQVTSINIDTSASQVIIINNGTMIENNGGTVNIGSENKSQDDYKSTGKSDGCSGSTTYTQTQTGFSNNEDKCRHRQICNKIEFDPWDWSIGFIILGISIGLMLLAVLVDSICRGHPNLAEIFGVGSIFAFLGSIGAVAALGVLPIFILHLILLIITFVIIRIHYGHL